MSNFSDTNSRPRVTLRKFLNFCFNTVLGSTLLQACVLLAFFAYVQMPSHSTLAISIHLKQSVPMSPGLGFRVSGVLENKRESDHSIKGIVLQLLIYDCPLHATRMTTKCPLAYESPQRKLRLYLQPGQSGEFTLDFPMTKYPEIKGWMDFDLQMGNELYEP